MAGCGSGESRVERCVDELMRTARLDDADTGAARAYVKRVYCDRFARNGWVYADSALSIAAQRWLVRGGRETCETATPSGTHKRIPCSRLPHPGPREIQCGMLRHVRRREVEAYLRKLGRVVCEDGTPLGALGVP